MLPLACWNFGTTVVSLRCLYLVDIMIKLLYYKCTTGSSLYEVSSSLDGGNEDLKAFLSGELTRAIGRQ